MTFCIIKWIGQCIKMVILWTKYFFMLLKIHNLRFKAAGHGFGRVAYAVVQMRVHILCWMKSSSNLT